VSVSFTKFLFITHLSVFERICGALRDVQQLQWR
jgi:hypothetical protein